MLGSVAKSTVQRYSRPAADGGNVGSVDHTSGFDRNGGKFVVSTYERLVVGVSGSASSAAALRWAAAEARLRGAEIWVVHAWSSPMETLAPYAPLHGVLSLDQQRQASRALLTAAIGHAFRFGCHGSGVGVRPILVEGDPVPVLLRYAADAHLLVLGRRLRSAHSEGIALGVVARACIANARCPAVVVAAAEVVDNVEASSSCEWHLCVG
jgi:nucleotide-binding universal stress UspA family protein